MNSSEQSLLTNNNQSTKGGVMKANEEVKTEYWDNGNKMFETHYKNGKKDGLQISWREDGTKESEGHWKDGKLNGISTLWYPSGKKKCETHYKNGAPERKVTYEEEYMVLEAEGWDSWGDNWTEDEGTKPVRFNSVEEAEKEIQEFLQDMRDSGMDGYHRDNFKIVETFF
jgi:antitoxin component YwqK of YwqJK toxin-antitoxin module